MLLDLWSYRSQVLSADEYSEIAKIFERGSMHKFAYRTINAAASLSRCITGLSAMKVVAACLMATALYGMDHFVSPNGSSSGDGSINNPWDLPTALSQPASVRPGDTIWLRGGTYRAPNSNGFSSMLNGTATSPIIVRNYNGERATLDGRGTENTLYVGGSYTWYWGLEIMDSNTNRTPNGCTATIGYSPHPSAWGVATYGPNNKFINMVAHDTAQGFSAYSTSPDNEFTGNLSYYNGNLPYPSCPGGDRNHGHGMYMQNYTGLKIVQDNIVGDNADEGLQIYGSGNAAVQGFRIMGNAFYNTSSWPFPYFQYNLLIAGGGVRKDIQVQNNYSYFTPSYDYGFVNFGQYTPGQDILVQNNVLAGGYTGVSMYDQAGPVRFTGNVLYVRPTAYEEVILQLGSGQTINSYTWDNNTYYGRNFFNIFSNYDFNGWKGATGFDTHSSFNPNAPTGVWVYVRPNQYESKRANIIIYNWDLNPQVAVDLSAVLHAGDPYVIQDTQNFYGPPVASGTYTGAPVNIPMGNLPKATPIGFATPAHTAPQFGTFIVMSSSGGSLPVQPPPDTTPPTISITSPGTGTTVSGTTSVSANAGDNVGVAGVQFQLNGSSLGAEVTTAPYSVGWNTTTVANGTYTLSAIARDAAGNKSTASVTVIVNNVVVSNPTPPPPSNGGFTPIRVSAGGPAYTDPTGIAWSADYGYSGPTSTFSTGATITGTNSPGVYQHERYGTGAFQYSFNVPNGTYTVNLKFAEIYVTGVGQRVFNVAINGQQVLSNFDILAAAGQPNRALDEPFNVSVTNGQINIQFTPGAVNAPKIDAIEILQLACPCTIWNNSATPKTVDAGSGGPVELGVKFRSEINGTITGLRFYKGASNTGTHVGNLWSSSGALLASAVFSNETASGWQQVNFSNPVPITAGTVYVASYHTNVSHFSIDVGGFATAGVDNPPLHALGNGVSGSDGVYMYGSTSSFPTNTYLASNYWVDVVFSTTAQSAPQPPPPSNTSSCPCTIWDSSATPKTADAGSGGPVELGVKFTADRNGSITGLRFFKSVNNTGPHVANLWSSNGSLLATATFSGETASGWQQVNFPAPVAITAGTVYVASYHTNVSHFSFDLSGFASAGVDNAPLHALGGGTNGGNGVYMYSSASVFPSLNYFNSNYWVDVVFQ